MTQAAAPKIKTGKWRYDHDLECMVEVRPGRNYFERNEKRSDLPCPAMHAGGMPTIKSMCDGQYYETKRNYYKSVSRAGCEIVGFDKRWEEQVKPPSGRDKAELHDVVTSVQQAIQEESNKLPPAGGLEDRRLMRKQRRKARASR